MLTLEQIPMRSDNYSYALIKDQKVVMIDPSEEQASLSYFASHPHLTLEAILCTHWHSDHVGGNEALWQQWRCPVYGPLNEKERVPRCSHPVKDGDTIELLGMKITAHDVRAHTNGHTAYFVDEKLTKAIKLSHQQKKYTAQQFLGHKVLFVGDSLFGAGCGRLFEGTAQNLVDVLQFYRKQDEKTLMACAHEYTASNLAFASHLLPDNPEIAKRHKELPALLEREGTSVPCLFGEEFLTNPFLLALMGPTRERLAQQFELDINDLVGIIGQLRKTKDDF